MDALDALVRDRDSELGRTARAALVGFVATLRAAGGTDPRAARAADQLAALLDDGTAPASTGRTEAFPSSPDESPWAALLTGWRARGEWKSVLAEPDLAADDPLPLWRLTHHLPPAVSTEWRTEWLRASGQADAPTPATVAGPFDWPLLPTLRLSPSAPLDPRITTAPAGPITAPLVLVLSAVLAWIDHDPALRHMLKGIYRFGTSPLRPAHQPRYERALLDRFGNLCEAEAAGDGARIVQTWVDFDEAVNSLVPVPPAHPTSALAGLGRACREVLPAVRAAAGDRQVHIQIPAGKYADARGVTDPDQDVEATAGGLPGEIVLCTRAFLRLDGQTHPGRVLYRPR